MPRYLGIVRGDENNRPTSDPSPELQQRMGALYEEITKAGVMLDTAALAPSGQAIRMAWKDGKPQTVDGPFTEAKEVVGGYSLMQCKNLEEAVEWTKRFAEIQGQHEDLTIEVREIVEG
ncbi:MAG TPA: YciI family protein [Stackebrandtia sp.]|jgi:hypothetical protein|uniref:YciI family protein n=1 Tax=Stackebrandtia sp. TaxID=2023065 RepID=UPI002D636ECB|nr:YciI family protein [Stackebrandtia sp.]HZE40047.1 YciI family protein [Stackebrandtia sp.]